MVVELPLVLALAVELRHLLERIKHSLHDSLIRDIDSLPNLERVRANELVLDATDVNREVLDELRDAVTFLARELSVLDGLDLFGDMPVEERLQLAMLFVEGIDEEGVAALICIGDETFQTSNDPDELSVKALGQQQMIAGFEQTDYPSQEHRLSTPSTPEAGSRR